MLSLKELEIQRAEELIFNNLPPIFRVFVENSRKLNQEIEKYERLLISFMNDDGKVNGKLLSELFVVQYPKLAEWITIPQYDFYLKDEVEQILKAVLRK